MANGKIFEWLKQNRTWILCTLSCVLFGLVLLHACQTRTELLVKGNKIKTTITKTKAK